MQKQGPQMRPRAALTSRDHLYFSGSLVASCVILRAALLTCSHRHLVNEAQA